MTLGASFKKGTSFCRKLEKLKPVSKKMSHEIFDNEQLIMYAVHLFLFGEMFT